MYTTDSVVSANYKDRESEFKWLIRAEHQHSEKAKEFQFVKAIGVEFKDSNAYEIGFGCTKVAFCKIAEGSNSPFEGIDQTKLTMLSFEPFWGYFYVTGSVQKRVKELNELYLDKDGKMWGQLTGSVQTKATKKERMVPA